MCQYSADDGHTTDWHLVHYGGFATRGVGAICVEASAVVPEGRISPEDAGIWKDSHIEPWRRVTQFAHAQGTMIGIQLAHAGRKASCHAPWVSRKAGGTSYVAQKDENGWPDNVRGPSNLAFSASFPEPKALSVEEINQIVEAFVAAARRAEAADFDFVEIHSAHGYLIHEFLSPVSNLRTDAYGGSYENRARLLHRVVDGVRGVWSGPLFVRISASDWLEGPEKGEDGEWKYWGIEQSTFLAKELYEAGVDLLDVSSGGLSPAQNIDAVFGYQVPFAAAIKKAVPELAVGAVGLITEAEKAEGYLQDGKADVIFLGREMMRNPHWPIHAANTLNVAVKKANQYERAW